MIDFFKKREKTKTRQKDSDHGVLVLMVDHEGMNVAYQLKHFVRLPLIHTKSSFSATKVRVNVSIYMGLTLN